MKIISPELLLMLITLNFTLCLSKISKPKPEDKHLNQYENAIEQLFKPPVRPTTNLLLSPKENNKKSSFDIAYEKMKEEEAKDSLKYKSRNFDINTNKYDWTQYLPDKPRDQGECNNCWAFSII